MATKFSLDPSPTFKTKVGIPVPGKQPALIEFEFKHFPRDEYAALFQREPLPTDTDLIMDVVVGWELDDPFNAESVEKLTQNYQGAAAAIIKKFCEEVGAARLGN